MSVCRFGKGIYPDSDEGSSDKVGEGAGRGKNVNFAFDGSKLVDTDYLPSFSAALLMIKVSERNMMFYQSAQEHDPALIIVSAGFDAASGDDLGDFELTPGFFGHMMRVSRNIT